MAYRILIVDDEPIFLDKMVQICRDFCEEHRIQTDIASFISGESFLGQFEKNKFSIVFMDIYMEEMSGITVALKMRQKDNFCILVFLTSSSEFMPDAFSCHAFEYIVKPISQERVTKVLQDAMSVLFPYPQHMEIVSGRRTIPVLYRDIISAVTDGHYLNITLTDESILRSRMTMSEFICLTHQEPRFILINKGILVNADYVVKFSGNCCFLKNDICLPIRIRGRMKIEQALRDYQFTKNSIQYENNGNHF